MIGVFDSGLGGLGVVGHIRRLLPRADILYLGDRARAPYGTRTLSEVRTYSEQIVDHLLRRGAETIVVACNTASAAALHHLRDRHPTVGFVGMEPAVKPATGLSRTGVIGVLATEATFQSELFASLVDRHANGTRVVCRPCHGWVELVESGLVDGHDTATAVRRHVEPVLEEGADVLVLGCTHYPFLAPTIERVTGDGVKIVDPAEAVARQVARRCADLGSGGVSVEVTGTTEGLGDTIRRLTGLAVTVQAVTLGT